MRGGRFFDHGDLRYLILKLIAEKPRHGYELIKAIEEQFGGAYSPSPGVIYPTLTMLEELGYAAAAAEGNKKLYTITPEGQAFLDQNQAQVDAVLARLKEAGQTFGGSRAPEIKRAVHNLRLALATRLGRGALTQEQILAVTALLDKAAAEIERI
jgi:DNA-binding PadR family transcriptional regulator